MWSLENAGLVASTQQSARDRLQAGQRRPFVLWSTQQQSGVGQHGRQWVHAGEALACSFCFAEPRPPEVGRPLPWPLWVGLAAAEAVEQSLGLAPFSIGIKWPNDLYWKGRKCGGVLVSRCPAGADFWLIAGIGLNLRWTHAPEGFVASGLLEQDDRPWEAQMRDRLLGGLAQALRPLIEQTFDPGPWPEAFARRDWLSGQRVWLHHPGTQAPLAEGVAAGIDGLGRLRLGGGPGQQEQAFAIGEASPRPTGGLG